MDRKFLAAGSLLAFLAVAAGAFGAHGLKNHLESDMLAIFETAVKYQMYHSLALILVSTIIKPKSGLWLVRSGWLFLAGIAVFSGSLYILSLTGIKWFGALTPLGGLAFLGGWFSILMHALKERSN
jgi:uncharacterized membrane protein YgdD (TMEM256/DUF423 family)